MFMNSGADLAPELRPRTPALSIDQGKLNDLIRPVPILQTWRGTKSLRLVLGGLVLNFYCLFVQKRCGPIFATKNVCKNLIANVQLEAMGQEQVVQKQKTVGC